MSLRIAGTGWVTPLGSDLASVWQQLLAGEEAVVQKISDPVSGTAYPVFRVPDTALSALPQHPRLRRASAISRFAAAAGLAALQSARSTLGQLAMERMALVFAVSNGGVVYTKRFYHDIVSSGAQAASPLLFPETVFNAPASHLAAILGVTGVSYTVVGDGAVGIAAIKMAEDLLADCSIDHCLVVAAEEADWLLCDAYRRWRLLRSAPPIEPFSVPAKGMILSEGAGAVVVGRDGPITVDCVHGGSHYSNRRRAAERLRDLIKALGVPGTGLVVGSANGTFIDRIEAELISEIMPEALIYTPKAALGESVGASALWQVVVAVEALRTQQLPPLLHGPDRMKKTPAGSAALDRAIVLSCGLNQQVAGVRLSI